MPVLKPTQIKVDHRGDLVIVQIGSSTMELPYEVALQFSQWLRVHGKAAKQKAGDLSRHWSAIAMLDPRE
jgi:hypothetical protein